MRAETYLHEIEAPAQEWLSGTADSELRSLFSLLDDPDERIALAVTERILQRGSEAIAPLASFAEHADSVLAKNRAERISAEFSAGYLTHEFEILAVQFAEGNRAAFENGLLLVARFGNPLLK